MKRIANNGLISARLFESNLSIRLITKWISVLNHFPFFHRNWSHLIFEKKQRLSLLHTFVACPSPRIAYQRWRECWLWKFKWIRRLHSFVWRQSWQWPHSSPCSIRTAIGRCRRQKSWIAGLMLSFLSLCPFITIRLSFLIMPADCIILYIIYGKFSYLCLWFPMALKFGSWPFHGKQILKLQARF